MDVQHKLRFAKAYRSMGDAIMDQVDDLLESNFEELNENAVTVIKQKLGHLDEEILSACYRYEQWQEEQPKDDED